MKERMPKTTPIPTPDSPLGEELGLKAPRVFPLPAEAIAIVARSRKTTTSTASRVRSTRTEVLMLRTDRTTTMAMKTNAKIHQGRSALKVVWT
jgi:hypothetical protein